MTTLSDSEVTDVDSAETYISLYAGGGGLDLGFGRARPDAECVAFVEHEASAAALLVDHVEADLLDAAPVFTDAFTFPAAEFHGLVDWIIGGPPCQPFSVAGKQLGADDPRNLWPLTLRMVADIQPTGCFFENVPSADSLWYVYSEVIPGLQHLGYEVKAGIFSAAEVGAPHNRERIFLLAYRVGGLQHFSQTRRGVERSVLPERRRQQGSDGAATRSGELADATIRRHDGSGRARRGRAGLADIGPDVGFARHGTGSTEQRKQPEGAASGTRQSSEAMGDANQSGSQGRQRPEQERGYERPAWPPGPEGDWSDVPERLWPTVEPGFCDVADELAGRLDGLSRSQELRILGNGVVPATAERAFQVLSEGISK